MDTGNMHTENMDAEDVTAENVDNDIVNSDEEGPDDADWVTHLGMDWARDWDLDHAWTGSRRCAKNESSTRTPSLPLPRPRPTVQTRLGHPGAFPGSASSPREIRETVWKHTVDRPELVEVCSAQDLVGVLLGTYHGQAGLSAAAYRARQLYLASGPDTILTWDGAPRGLWFHPDTDVLYLDGATVRDIVFDATRRAVRVDHLDKLDENCYLALEWEALRGRGGGVERILLWVLAYMPRLKAIYVAIPCAGSHGSGYARRALPEPEADRHQRAELLDLPAGEDEIMLEDGPGNAVTASAFVERVRAALASDWVWEGVDDVFALADGPAFLDAVENGQGQMPLVPDMENLPAVMGKVLVRLDLAGQGLCRRRFVPSPLSSSPSSCPGLPCQMSVCVIT